MKLNSSYYSNENKQKVIRKLDLLDTLLQQKIREKFNVFKVSHPLFLERNSELLMDYKNRAISFDSASRKTINTFIQEYSFWLTNALDSYEIEIGRGILITPATVLRDQIESPIESLVREDLIVEINVEKDRPKAINLVREYTKVIYQIIRELSSEMRHAFGEVIPELKPQVEYATSQLLENEFGDFSFREREKMFFSQNDIFILENPGQKLFSGKYHYDENPILFDLKAQNVLIGKSHINDEPIKIAKISLRAIGPILSDQIELFSVDYVLSNTFIQRMLKEERPWSIQIKVNKLALALFMLRKGYISEIIPDSTNLQVEMPSVFRRLSTL